MSDSDDCCREITTKISHKSYYGENNCLINAPSALQGQSEPTAIFHRLHLSILPKYSIVMPIHDMQHVVKKNVSSIMEMTTGLFEVIIILDHCCDETKSILLHLLQTYIAPQNLCEITIIEQSTAIFETSCDNLGFVLAKGDYIVEIQADMQMTEKGFNEQLAMPLLLYEDVIAVSGRCCHNFLNQAQQCVGTGKIGALIDDNSEFQKPPLQFYVNATCNRGPLLLCRKKLCKLKFLDEVNFALGNDDHDLFARAYYLYGYVCGYVPIEFSAPLRDGTMRRPRPQAETDILVKRLARSNGGFLGLISLLAPPATFIRSLKKTTLQVSFFYTDQTLVSKNVTNEACDVFVIENEICIPQFANFNDMFTDVSPGKAKVLLIVCNNTQITLAETRTNTLHIKIK